MNDKRALRLIRESIELAKQAPIKQKIQILKMIQEYHARVKNSHLKTQITESRSKSISDPDYVKEK